MAVNDILAPTGDDQDFIIEIPAGNAGYTPADVLNEADESLMCSEIPVVTGNGGGNIFIMSE